MQFFLKSFCSLLLLSLVLACNNNNSQHTKQVTNEPAFAELLSDADMLEIRWVLNEDKPDTDSILFVHDSNYIQKLIKEISKEETEANTCGTEGKIYFHKEGSVFKTVYFSTADSCRFFGYVINGKQYFTQMQPNAVELITNPAIGK